MFLLLKSGTPCPGGEDQIGVSPYHEIAALIVLLQLHIQLTLQSFACQASEANMLPLLKDLS